MGLTTEITEGAERNFPIKTRIQFLFCIFCVFCGEKVLESCPDFVISSEEKKSLTTEITEGTEGNSLLKT